VLALPELLVAEGVDDFDEEEDELFEDELDDELDDCELEDELEDELDEELELELGLELDSFTSCVLQAAANDITSITAKVRRCLWAVFIEFPSLVLERIHHLNVFLLYWFTIFILWTKRHGLHFAFHIIPEPGVVRIRLDNLKTIDGTVRADIKAGSKIDLVFKLLRHILLYFLIGFAREIGRLRRPIGIGSNQAE